jgi:hypothetical protein
MDVKKFQNAREQQLADFQKQYSFLKSEYSTALASAIKESDPASQSVLIQRVQEINAQMAEELRTILTSLNKGSDTVNPKMIDELTDDLIKYQKDYHEIEQSHDKVVTLRMILGTTKETLKNSEFMYYGLLTALLLLCFTIPYLIFKNSITSTIASVLPQKPLTLPI